LALLASFSSFGSDFSNCIDIISSLEHSGSYNDEVIDNSKNLTEDIAKIAKLKGVQVCTKTKSGQVEFYASGDLGNIRRFYHAINEKFITTD
jgi:uncharacterized ParB-like nuclease family protein